MNKSDDLVSHICELKETLSPEDVDRLAKKIQIAPRVLALALIENNAGKLLVDTGYDPKKQVHFYRLLGGGVQFGEAGAESVVRELMEETGLQCRVEAHLGTFENIFTFDGKPGHEIILVYRVKLMNPNAYNLQQIEVDDTSRAPTKAVWKSIEEIKNEGRRLFPEGIVADK